MVAFKGEKHPAPLVTFGAVHESNLVEGETRMVSLLPSTVAHLISGLGNNGKVQKSLRMFPGAVENARVSSLLGGVKKASYIGLPAWNGALQFSTKQESTEKKDFWDDNTSSKSGSRVPCAY